MIESKNDTSKNLEKALQALEQAKQRVANEKKKQNEKKRKAENHHKYIMGGIIVKYRHRNEWWLQEKFIIVSFLLTFMRMLVYDIYAHESEVIKWRKRKWDVHRMAINPWKTGYLS